MEKQQLLRDPNIEPTHEVIAEALGMANDAYRKFCETLPDHGIQLEWRYYNDGKAWLSKGEYKWVTSRGTKKVKPVFWLSIWEGFFKVTFFFATAIRGELLNLPISQSAKEIILTAESMGKTQRFMPIVFDVKSSKQLEDVYILAEYRKAKI